MEWIGNLLSGIYSSLTSFFSTVVDVLSNVRSIFTTIWYALGSLLSSVLALLNQLF